MSRLSLGHYVAGDTCGFVPVLRNDPSFDNASNQNGAPNDTANAVTSHPSSFNQKSQPFMRAVLDHAQHRAGCRLNGLQPDAYPSGTRQPSAGPAPAGHTSAGLCRSLTLSQGAGIRRRLHRLAERGVNVEGMTDLNGHGGGG
jgi:hypothetical protein